MRVSELIKKLDSFQEANGDCQVMIDDLYVLNGVGGRGFVLSLYLANQLVQNVISNKALDEDITNYRLFSRWAKKQRN